MLARRSFLHATAAAVSASIVPPAFAQKAAFTLPALGYAYDALEPHIDARTMEIHHNRHHQAYVDALNAAATRWPELAPQRTEEILRDFSKVPEKERTIVRNNLGGHWNHSFFWRLMAPGGAREPGDKLRSSIDATFGDLDKMKAAVNAAAASRFGSGWAWLIIDKEAKLTIVTTANQDTPLDLDARSVLLGVDVWEHAYYLKYQSRRAEYLNAWWHVLNWDRVEAEFAKAKG